MHSAATIAAPFSTGDPVSAYDRKRAMAADDQPADRFCECAIHDNILTFRVSVLHAQLPWHVLIAGHAV
jgi:hypothetical protein